MRYRWDPAFWLFVVTQGIVLPLPWQGSAMPKAQLASLNEQLAFYAGTV